MSTEATQDLNQIISSAVNARIEAAVGSALASDEVVGKFVSAALMQEVQRDTGNYRSEKVTYLHKVLLDAIQEATRLAAAEAVEAEKETIREQVRKALQQRTDSIADGLVDSFADGVRAGYAIKIEVVARERH